MTDVSDLLKDPPPPHRPRGGHPGDPGRPAHAPRPRAGRATPPAGSRSPASGAAASRSPCPTAGSSWPRPTTSPRARPGRSTCFGQGPRPLPDGLGRAPHGRRPLPAPRRPPRRRRQGRGGVPALPVPRLVLRPRRPVRRDPVLGQPPHPVQGPRPVVPDPRAQPDDLGLAPRRGGRALLRRARGRGVRQRRLDRHRLPGVRDRHRLPGDGREQRRLRPLPLRARHRRHPRGRVPRRRHLQAHRGPGRQLRAGGLRPRPRRPAHQGLGDVPVLDHARSTRRTSSCAGSSPRRRPTASSP